MNENTEQRLANLSPAKRALLEARMTRREGKVQHSQSIPRRVEDAKSGLSFAQERIWLHQQIQPSSIAYNRPTNIRLKGPLDVTIFRLALAQLLERHESLRSTVACEEGNPYLVVKEAESLEMPLLDLRGEVVPEDRAQEIAAEEACRPFDLGRGPLLRAQLLRLGNEEHLLLLTIHHYTFDAWSEPVLLDELSSNYGALRRGDTTPRKALPIQCTDFAAWDRSVDRVAGLDSGRAYWRAALADPPVLQLKTDYPLPLEPSEEARDVEFELPDQLLARLREMAKREEATLFSLLLSAFVTLLHRYTGEEDIVVGCPVAGRTREELEPLIGVFINMLPLRAKVGARDSFRSLLGRVQESVLQGLEHQEVPLQFMVQDVLSDRDSGGSPLYQTMFIHERLPLEPREVDSVSFESEEAPAPGAIMDLTMEVSETESRVIGRLKYRRELWDEPTIACMVGHFLTLLEGFTIDPGKCLGELPMLTEGERHQLLVAWNDTAVEYPDKCVHQLFEEQVVRAPEAVAVVFEDKQLTYGELNERANRVAHALIAHGVGPEVLVAICVERSFEMIVGLLGILKAGGAYVPLDPDYPEARLAFMLEDCGKPLLVTTEGLSKRFAGYAGDRLFLDDGSALAGQPVENPGIAINPEQLAYVIYTSGSTGRPKGSMVSHGALVNHMCWMRESFPIEPSDKLLQKTPFTFDASVWEFFAPLLEGGQLVMALPDGHRNPGYLIETMIDQSITVLQVVPTLLRALMSHKGFPQTRSLKRVFSGGESLTTDLQATFFSQSHASLYNLYGPTEACIDTTAWPCRRDDLEREVAIGRPIANVQVYVIDRHGQVVPIGIPGELYIGGAGLARGYLNRPELTAERFVEIDILGRTERVYRTGDLCCWRSDGNLEFLGRLDDQVKLRGFRIELGEIEAVLIDHPDVAQCVVVLREDHPGDQRLVAYCVPKAHGVLNTNALREHVGERLPNYMVPSAFVLLDKFPLTSSGKISRRDLPEPDGSRQELGADYVAPRSLIEENLVLIWNEVLGIERVGIHDNFFELGGHSLVAIRVNARISSELQVDFSVRNLFEAPTIAGLANKIEELRRVGAGMSSLPLVRVTRDPGCGWPLSFSQQRLWFLEQLEGELTAYNMSFGWRIRGELDAEALRGALETLVNRHEVLRTTFAMPDDEPVQVVGEAVIFDLPVVDLTPLDSEAQALEISRFERQEAGRAFDLKNDLMLRAFLLRLSENEHVLLIVMHHIASDGWSLGVLRRELGKLYRAYCRGEEAGLSPLAVQYADFAIWQREGLASGGRIEELLTYWRGQLSGLEALELPTDRSRPLVPSYRGATHEFEIPGDLVDRLKVLGNREGATLQMTLLAAFQVLLSRYSGQDDIAVGTPIAGRNRIELEGQIGFFVNTLVLRTDLSGEPTFRELLGLVREVSLGAYDHQDLPFEKLVEELQPERNLGRSPLFQVTFQLINFPDDEFQLKDLEVLPLPSTSERVRFDLEMHLQQRSEMLSGVIVYSTDLFEASRIERMVGHFLTLLEGLAAHPEERIGELPILRAHERHQLLVEWNDTAVKYPARCVHELFEDQVERTPEAVAVVFEDKQLTYCELNERANRVAHALIAHGVGPDALVGICVERSFEMIAGLLGILKAGGAYVPLDPDYPEARLAFMLEDCGKPLLVTTEGLSKRFVGLADDLLFIDHDSALAGQPVENPGISSNLDHLAYIIYTSGSTGRPKGVEIPHRGVVRLVCEADYCRFDHDRVFLQFAPLSFDAATFEIWGALLHGARLVLAPSGRETMDRIPELIGHHGITTAWLTAGLFNQFVDKGPGALSGLEELLIGGEALSPGHVSKAIAGLPGTRIINGYGPTENTTFTSTFQIESCEDHSAISIGRPIANTRVYILDDALHPLPIGVAGELAIGGDGLARGYLNRPELTAERFVEIDIPGRTERVYRTGDLCRWKSDGHLEFLGRIDHQVKIRGFRIELGEIEAVLAACPGVRDSAVMAREDMPGDKRLVAYLVLDQNDPATTPAMRRSLAEKLPDYMIPAAFVPLDALPLTPNGKLDRRALPAPDASRPELDLDCVAPRTMVEEKLSEVWRELLGVERVGIHDNFFELGGHSLLVARLVGVVNERLDCNLMIGEVYRSPTIAGMADLLRRSEGKDASGTVANVGHFLTVLQKGSGGGCVVLIGVPRDRLKELPTSLLILSLAIDGVGRSSFLGLGIQDTAKAYADELEMMTLAGPVVIAGYSYGGLLAYALAHTLRERPVRNFELILLEPTWFGSDTAGHRTLLQKVQLAIDKGPGSLMKSVVFRVRHKLKAARIEAETEAKTEKIRFEIGRRLEAGEQLDARQLFKYYKKEFIQKAREYQPPGRLEGRVHLVFGGKWGESCLPGLTREYLECSPVLLNLGEVDHFELVDKESTAMPWVELVCLLVSPSQGAEDVTADEEESPGH